jgi:hypothetical protein
MEKESKAGGLESIIKRRNQIARNKKKVNTDSTVVGDDDRKLSLNAKE